jgi:hypothetical protein
MCAFLPYRLPSEKGSKARGNPSPGTTRTSARLDGHDDHRLTSLPVCRRNCPCRWLGVRPGARADASPNGANRVDCAGPELKRQAEPVERRHPSEGGGPGDREARARRTRSQRGAAAGGDFGRRCRASTKVSPSCDRLEARRACDRTRGLAIVEMTPRRPSRRRRGGHRCLGGSCPAIPR